MIVLDTDVFSLLENRESVEARRVTDRLRALDGTPVRATVVTFEEQLRGWLAHVAAAKAPDRLVAAYERLRRFHAVYRREELLPFDAAAAARFAALRAAGVRIGTMDLRIAAIALAAGATLVTRNLSDFRQVPGLTAEDWTAAPP